MADTSTMPDVFAFRTVTGPGGPYGYIRIWTFCVNDDDAFVNEFVRMAGLLPKNGLIIDVRGNGGGNILCAERLLQVLTPGAVEPSLLSFINSQLTLRICKENDFVAEWVPSINQAVETGEAYSQGFSILPLEDYNNVGQRYQGPVMLITDPLCYSATDIFSAGLPGQPASGSSCRPADEPAPVAPTSGRTSLLRQVLPGPDGPFTALPQGASFRVSIRRVIRAGTHRGVPLEDLGVAPDQLHNMTKNDLLNDNADLIAKAAQMLAALPRISLTASIGPVVAGKRTITVTTQKLDRVDVAWTTGRAPPSMSATGRQPWTLPTPAPATTSPFADSRAVCCGRSRTSRPERGQSPVSFASPLSGHHPPIRALLRRLAGAAQIVRGVDQRDVRERLREIADLPLRRVSYSSASSPTSLRSASSRSNSRRASSMRPIRT